VKDIIKRIARQPAKLLAFVQAVVGFGLVAGFFQAENIDQITGALLLLLSAGFAVISEYVTPIDDPNLPIGTVVNANSDTPTGVVVAASDIEGLTRP
jgi:hypothetical protein